MRFDIITIFPELFAGVLDCGILRRARNSGLVDVRIINLRDFAKDNHRSVDDRPYGGGEGMVLMPGPLCEAGILSRRAQIGGMPGSTPIPSGTYLEPENGCHVRDSLACNSNLRPI